MVHLTACSYHDMHTWHDKNIQQVKFLENEKLILKEPDNLKNNKIQLFEKGQYSTAHVLHTKI